VMAAFQDKTWRPRLMWKKTWKSANEMTVEIHGQGKVNQIKC
jgi:hypothetical protein